MFARRAAVALAIALPLLVAAPAHAFVYWADAKGGTIGRANLDGTGVDDAFITVGGEPISVAVDSGHIYWANRTTGSVGRANIDGGAANNAFVSGIAEPLAVAVNSSSIYWSSLGGNEIGRANIDGTGRTLGLVTGAQTPCGIALDNGHVYWGSVTLPPAHIGRASLTGNSPEPLWLPIGTAVPCGLAVNSANVFWANTGFLGAPAHEIGRANISGTVVDPSMIGDADGPCGLALDGPHLYWANEGSDTIGRANTDATGLNENLVVTGGTKICGIAVDALAPPPAGPPSPPAGGSAGQGGSGGGAGSGPPAPPPIPASLKLLRTKDDAKRGTAELTLSVSAAGKLTLRGPAVRTVNTTAPRAGTVTVPVRPKRALAGKLQHRGHARVAIKVALTLSDGTKSTLSKTVKLVEKLSE